MFLRQNVQRDKTAGEKTSGDITSLGPNVQRDKKRRNVREIKRPEGQNVVIGLFSMYSYIVKKIRNNTTFFT
jgi:hypothetical protein